MRKLTIKRLKSGAACLAKTKFYIVVPYGDTMINGEKCAFLCELKNGEEKSFEINCEQQKIYAICDSLTKNYCNDYYIIDSGEQDVYLTGSHKLNPLIGNPFRFDNNTSAGAEQNRKKGGKKGVLVYVLASVIGFIVGYLIIALALF